MQVSNFCRRSAWALPSETNNLLFSSLTFNIPHSSHDAKVWVISSSSTWRRPLAAPRRCHISRKLMRRSCCPSMDLCRFGRKTVGPIYDPQNVDHPIKLWSAEMETSCYPPKEEPYAPTEIPPRPPSCSDKYLRPYLAKNERLRLSMLWYHTRDILNDTEFLSGLQEKACFAQESTG